MSAPDESRCQACGSLRDEVRKLISAGGPALCDQCIQRYGAALSEALSADSRARSEISPLVAAEEMALNLIDQLEASRAQKEELDLIPPERRPLLKLLQFDESPIPGLSKQAAGHDDPERVSMDAGGASEARPTRPPVAVIAAGEADFERLGLDGRPLVRIAAERCRESGVFSDVIIATSDARVADVVAGWGLTAQLLPESCRAAVDQLAEVARSREEPAGFVGVPSERLFSSELFAAVVGLFDDPEVEIATVVRPLSDGERANPELVKVVLGQSGDALYFSRADLPFEREGAGPVSRFAHVPVVAYRRDALLQLAEENPSPLEQIERHEALRALESGFRIRCLVAP